MSHLSLSERVQEALGRSKPELGVAFSNTFRPKSKDEAGVQVELNKYLRLQLAKAPVSTLDERQCLIDEISAGQWFEYFESHVLPTLVRFNLPQE